MDLGFGDLVEDGKRVVEARREGAGGEEEIEKEGVGAVEVGF